MKDVRCSMTLPVAMQGKEPLPRLVFPLGEPPQNDDRKWRFTMEDFRRVADNFAKRREALPIYVMHGDDPTWGKKAAGWADTTGIVDEGLGVGLRYTDLARDEIRAGHWGYVSPGFRGEEDAEGFIHPVELIELSLVNEPAIGGMPPLAATVTKPSPPQTAAGKEPTMANETVPVTAAKTKGASSLDRAAILETFRSAFKFPDVVDDDMLAEMLMARLGMGGGPKDGEPPPAGADQGGLPPGLALLSERLKKQEEETAALKRTKDEEAVIEAGVKDRKLSPALVEAARAVAKHGGIEALKAYVTSLPESQPAPGAAVKPGAPAGLTPDEVRAPFDHVGRNPEAYDPERFRVHTAAVAYRDRAEKAGRKVSYRDAVVAVTRKKSA